MYIKLFLVALYLENSDASETTTAIPYLKSGANVFIRRSDTLGKKCVDPSYLSRFRNHCGYEIDDGGWDLVRHVPNGTKWHSSTDKLQGIDAYGDSSEGPKSTTAWSIQFNSTLANYDELLVASGDCKHWLIVNKQVLDEKLGNVISAPDHIPWNRFLFLKLI